MSTLTRPPSRWLQFSSLYRSKVQLYVRRSVGCFNVLLLTGLCRRTRQDTPSWKRHVHINGTIYYSLEIQDQCHLFRRMITAEDVTDPDIRSIIEDCGDEYHQWLEEADLEDLPDDLELLVHFNDPYDREPLGTFMSYQKEVKFQCCPVEYEDAESDSVSSSYIIVLSCRIVFRSHHYSTPGLLTHPWWSWTYSRSKPFGFRQNRIPCIIRVATPIWKWLSSPPWPIALTVWRRHQSLQSLGRLGD
jgi:hypothetical protein